MDFLGSLSEAGVHSPGHLSLTQLTGEIQELNLNSHPMAFTMCPLVTQVCFMPPSHPNSFAVAFSLPVNPSDVACTYSVLSADWSTLIENSFLWFSLCLSPNYKLNHSHLSSAYNLLGFLNSKKGICNNSLKFQEALWTSFKYLHESWTGSSPWARRSQPCCFLCF